MLLIDETSCCSVCQEMIGGSHHTFFLVFQMDNGYYAYRGCPHHFQAANLFMLQNLDRLVGLAGSSHCFAQLIESNERLLKKRSNDRKENENENDLDN